MVFLIPFYVCWVTGTMSDILIWHIGLFCQRVLYLSKVFNFLSTTPYYVYSDKVLREPETLQNISLVFNQDTIYLILGKLQHLITPEQKVHKTCLQLSVTGSFQNYSLPESNHVLRKYFSSRIFIAGVQLKFQTVENVLKMLFTRKTRHF